MGRRPKSVSGLTRRQLLKYGLYGGLAAGLSNSLWLTGCNRRRRNKKPNIVIIVMDTVRQDHLSCYGYHRDTTPTLRGLLSDSRIYEAAYSVSSWTSPSHASLFTGLYPIAHDTTQERWDLDENLVTLAQVLTPIGYQTVGIVENPMLTIANNFHQGFSMYYEVWKVRLPILQKHGDVTLLQFRKTLKQMEKQKPFFFFINLNEAHNPYNSSRQFKNAFVSNPLIEINGHDRRDYYLGKREYSQAEFRHLNELYDAEILYVDCVIGQMIDELKSTGKWDDTIFIVTSDHGENIGDHSHVDHVFSLYQSTIRIPLIIHYPILFASNSSDTDIAQLTDIFPTLLNILEVYKKASQGIDLLNPNARKKRAVFCEYYRPVQAMNIYGKEKNNKRLQKYNKRLKSIIHDDIKLVWGSDGRHELYNLGNDPGENQNIIDSAGYSDVRQKLIGALENLTNKYTVGKKKRPKAPEKQLDEKTINALKSLGYLR